jgi:3-oxoacyl-[acyl-carrier protein] reductase
MKNVVITGCNRGLGLTMLKTFAKSNYNIVACVRKKNDEFIDICDKIEKEDGIKIYPIYFDLSKNELILKGMEGISSLDIEIDVLINNAGIIKINSLMYTEYEDVENTFRINYFAPVLITKMITDLMIRQNKGVIINISSIGGLGHQPGGVCYDASKAALNQFTVSLAQELATFHIRANAVAPGPMQTGMFENLNEEVKRKLLQSIAVKRPATLEEIANVVLFLASDESSYITGQVIRVDGGSKI